MSRTNKRAAPLAENAASKTNEGAQTPPQGENQDPKRVLMLKQVSEDAPSKLGVFKRVYASTAAPRTAIKAKCLECCWMDVAGIWECMATACALWGFRPYQQKGGAL